MTLKQLENEKKSKIKIIVFGPLLGIHIKVCLCHTLKSCCKLWGDKTAEFNFCRSIARHHIVHLYTLSINNNNNTLLFCIYVSPRETLLAHLSLHWITEKVEL